MWKNTNNGSWSTTLLVIEDFRTNPHFNRYQVQERDRERERRHFPIKIASLFHKLEIHGNIITVHLCVGTAMPNPSWKKMKHGQSFSINWWVFMQTLDTPIRESTRAYWICLRKATRLMIAFIDCRWVGMHEKREKYIISSTCCHVWMAKPLLSIRPAKASRKIGGKWRRVFSDHACWLVASICSKIVWRYSRCSTSAIPWVLIIMARVVIVIRFIVSVNSVGPWESALTRQK